MYDFWALCSNSNQWRILLKYSAGLINYSFNFLFIPKRRFILRRKHCTIGLSVQYRTHILCATFKSSAYYFFNTYHFIWITNKSPYWNGDKGSKRQPISNLRVLFVYVDTQCISHFAHIIQHHKTGRKYSKRYVARSPGELAWLFRPVQIIYYSQIMFLNLKCLPSFSNNEITIRHFNKNLKNLLSFK